MAEEEGEHGHKKLGTYAMENPKAYTHRYIATVYVIPALLLILGGTFTMTEWLVVDKVDGIERHIASHDEKFDKIDDKIGLIVANQSAGQAQRDAQQKQIDGLADWLKTIVRSRGH